MAATTFDTLKYANTLKAAGMTAIVGEAEQRLNAKIYHFAAKIEAPITLVKWMIGLAITLHVAMLVRLFFARLP